MDHVKKVYGYVTRMKNGNPQVLVFQHPIPEAGIQIPKGTVKVNEDTVNAVVREIKEETGLENVIVKRLIAKDYWTNDDGNIHNRFFYELYILDALDKWNYKPTGGGEEEGLNFQFFWISSIADVELVRGHGDYLKHIFT